MIKDFIKYRKLKQTLSESSIEPDFEYIQEKLQVNKLQSKVIFIQYYIKCSEIWR